MFLHILTHQRFDELTGEELAQRVEERAFIFLSEPLGPEGTSLVLEERR
jgi:hypothetical protein